MRNSANIELIGYVYGEPKYPMPEKHPNWITFSMSVTEKYKDKQGEEKKNINWFRCSSGREGLSTIISKNVKEGVGLLVRGKPKLRAYADKEGYPQASFEVNINELNILTYPENNPNYSTQGGSSNANGKYKLNKGVSPANGTVEDDKIPF